MDLLLAWVAFPALLTALATGCGALVEALAGRRLPVALLPAIGFAAIVVIGQFLTLADSTAELTTPTVAVAGAAGLVVLAARRRRLSGWGAAAAAAVFAVYAAPIVLSGEPTFAGYIRLDDTATWMALTDRVLEHGRSLDGLAPSTYEATLAFNLADGYPIGVFLPLGVGRELVGQDVAWLIQPYMAWLAALLALALWSLARRLVVSPAWRAAVVFVAAQPALLFGYYLWGGVKEVAAAMLIASLAACTASLLEGGWAWRSLIAPATLCAGLIGVLSAGGLLWLVPALAVALPLAARRLSLRRLASRTLCLVGLVAVLSAPVLVSGGLLPPTSAPLTDGDARGNLLGALEPAQLAGIWPAGDFRFDPGAELVAYALIAAAILAAAAGLALAWRRRRWGGVAYVGGATAAAALIWALGSPWVGGKALAIASPAIPFAAMSAGVMLIATRHRLAGWVLVGAVASGVLWSNALAFRDVNLAPRERLVELEQIGERIAGQGPTLMTEYEPYGARHFLREADAEGASELRRRQVALASGGTLAKGETVDTDELDPAALLLYRTLVLRRSPTQSRPPAPYRLVWAGDSYEVWQRRAGGPPRSERIRLGTSRTPIAVPRCDRVLALAATAADRGGSLVAARQPRPIELPAPLANHRAVPTALEAEVRIDRRGEYEVWLEGSVRPRVDLAVDGRAVASVRHLLNNDGQYVLLGQSTLDRGKHRVSLDFGDADLHPGSGGVPASIGPLLLSRGEAADATLLRVGPAAAQRLCGRAWDWIELDV